MRHGGGVHQSCLLQKWHLSGLALSQTVQYGVRWFRNFSSPGVRSFA